jgi:hypothetical protein
MFLPTCFFISIFLILLNPILFWEAEDRTKILAGFMYFLLTKKTDMKKFYTISAIFLFAFSYGQTTPKNTGGKGAELNCYNKWVEKLDERGAEDVADGIYDDVIITVRSGPNADCFNGKVEVKDKKVLALYILREDNTYEELRWVWKDGGKNVTIHNGVSTNFQTKENKLVNVIWPKKIKPKKAPFKKAPEPVDD